MSVLVTKKVELRVVATSALMADAHMCWLVAAIQRMAKRNSRKTSPRFRVEEVTKCWREDVALMHGDRDEELRQQRAEMRERQPRYKR